MSITIVSQRLYKNHPIFRNVSLDDLPSACQTDGTLCGSFGTSTGPCQRYGVRGCPLRRLPGYHLDGVSA